MTALEIFIEKVEPEKSPYHWVNVNDAVTYHAYSHKFLVDEKTLDRLQEMLPNYDVEVMVFDGDESEIIVRIEGNENDIIEIVEKLKLPSHPIVAGSGYCICGEVISNGFVEIGYVRYYTISE